ncbi:MAG: c-type cytochrome [Acidobacteria bacterium]|nr:c-type cytochrome [Acidobacteriota bacterium]
MRRIAVLIPILVVAGLVAGWLYIRNAGGFSARATPTAVETIIARTARRLATPAGARDARNPVAFSSDVWAEARAHFADHCAICHANDGSGQTEIGQNLYPKAPDMRRADTQRLSDGEVYWIIRNGVRMTGMPAWGEAAGDDLESWKLVHFIRRLSELTPEHLEEMEAMNPRSPAELEEERQDREFLEGKPTEPSPGPPPHRHKEQI